MKDIGGVNVLQSAKDLIDERLKVGIRKRLAGALRQLLEAGAVAVIERPIRPFGLLTNLTIARSIWLEKRETEKRIRKLERKLSGIQRIQKAKAILMDGQGLSEADAYESIRRQAMAKRLSMDDMATAIIHANELLQYRAKDV